MVEVQVKVIGVWRLGRDRSSATWCWSRSKPPYAAAPLNPPVASSNSGWRGRTGGGPWRR